MIFEGLSDKLQGALSKLKSKGKLTEKDVKDAMREVKLALLEADVNISVVKQFVARVSERAVGQEILKSLSPTQQVIKIVNEELTALMGSTNAKLVVASKPPTVIMMCGLQGAGKTTTCAKVAKYFSSEFIAFDSSEKGDYAVCLAKYGSANVFEISVYNASGKLKNSISLNYKVLNMAMSNKYIFALAENCIMVYNLKGRNVGSIKINGKLYGIYPTDKYCYVHSLGNISRCFSYGDNELELGFTV